METGLVERMLRELPGVLDCSVTEEGVALVVHPEVDPRMIELRAKAVLAEAGDAKPLLVVGGMAVDSAAGSPPGRRPRVRSGRSPLSATGVVLLVVALLFVVPVAGRETSSDRPADDLKSAAPPPAPQPGPRLRLPVTEEPSDTPAPAEAAPPSEPVEAAPPTPTVATGVAPVSLAAAEIEDRGRGKLKVHGAKADTGRGSRDPRQRQTSGKPGGRKATGLREK